MFRQFMSNSQLMEELPGFEETEALEENVFSGLSEGPPMFEEMGLPSFKPLYLFLVKISLDVVHECLKLRLEQQPEEPSLLSVRQVCEPQKASSCLLSIKILWLMTV